MKKILKYGFLLILFFILFGCRFIPKNKFLLFENGNFITKIVIIDDKENKYEYNIEPECGYGWSEDIIGDFKFIFIKTENDLEGIFIVSNEYKKNIFPYDIISLNKYGKKIAEEYEHDKILINYDIDIKIIDEIFEIEYNNEKFNIFSFYNYNEDYLFHKEKYMKEYNYKE